MIKWELCSINFQSFAEFCFQISSFRPREMFTEEIAERLLHCTVVTGILAYFYFLFSNWAISMRKNSLSGNCTMSTLSVNEVTKCLISCTANAVSGESYLLAWSFSVICLQRWVGWIVWFWSTIVNDDELETGDASVVRLTTLHWQKLSSCLQQKLHRSEQLSIAVWQ